jgi:hypothetical protein
MYRIRTTNRGYFAEYKYIGILRDSWLSFINYRGANEPYPFSSYDSAMEAILSEIRTEINQNSPK